MEKGGKGARKELDLLASLLIIPGKSQATDNFKLNLFGDDDSGLGGGRSGSSGGGILMFGTHGKNEAYKKQAGLSSMMKSLNVRDQKSQSTGDDLLDLMDGAA